MHNKMQRSDSDLHHSQSNSDVTHTTNSHQFSDSNDRRVMQPNSLVFGNNDHIEHHKILNGVNKGHEKRLQLENIESASKSSNDRFPKTHFNPNDPNSNVAGEDPSFLRESEWQSQKVQVVAYAPPTGQFSFLFCLAFLFCFVLHCL